MNYLTVYVSRYWNVLFAFSFLFLRWGGVLAPLSLLEAVQAYLAKIQILAQLMLLATHFLLVTVVVVTFVDRTVDYAAILLFMWPSSGCIRAI